ncbi:MAG: 1-acyl-sn-glycerol-3-phosphate acyltransferase [Epsilonproteobacteria bacterium]|nr:1-acyl-sn-glycerol-3-phosphate acyltransferase [Campylobacterota bacterium]
MFFFRKHHKTFRYYWAKLQLFLLRVKLEVVGKPDKSAKMLLLNHQSVADIVIMEAIYPADLAWVAKKEIGDMPFFGHILDYPEMISIDREDRKSLIQLIKDAKDRLSKGRVLAIFPEGTRGNGRKLLKFKAGAKIVAEKLELKIQPAVFIGTINVFDSKNFLADFSKVKLVYLDPVEPKKGSGWYEKLREDMQAVLDKELS